MMAGNTFEEDTPASEGMPVLHPERPLLIVLEGIDLSGRTTQVELLRDWLLAQRYHVTTTAWRTSPLISDVLARAKLATPLRPLTYSLLYCADHLDRTQHVIRPALERREIVLADRYIYTAFARDTARGLDPAWARSLYRFSMSPDVVFYLHISPEEAVKRRLNLQRRRLEGMLAKEGKRDKTSGKEKNAAPPAASEPLLTGEALESFRHFEMKMYSEYQNMQKEFGFSVIEGNRSIDQVQAALRQTITRLLLNIP